MDKERMLRIPKEVLAKATKGGKLFIGKPVVFPIVGGITATGLVMLSAAVDVERPLLSIAPTVAVGIGVVAINKGADYLSNRYDKK